MIAMSERDSLIDQVAAVVRRSAKIPGKVAIRAESRLVEDLAIDSLDLVSLVLQLQDDFDVVFDEDAVPNLCRVGDIVEYLKQNGGRRAEGGGRRSEVGRRRSDVGGRTAEGGGRGRSGGRHTECACYGEACDMSGDGPQWRTLQDTGSAGITH